MDQATNVQVLKAILELSPQRYLSYPIIAVHKVLPDLTEEIVEGSIKELASYGLIKHVGAITQ